MSRRDREHRLAEMESSGEYAAWRRSVEKSLGESSFEEALVARLAGGLEVDPLYAAGSPRAEAAIPRGNAVTRGSDREPGWKIGQEIAHPWAVEAGEAMRADQERGVQLLWLQIGGIVSPGVWELETATDYSGVCVTSVDDFEKLLAAVEPGSEVVLYSGEEALATAAMWVAATRRLGLGLEEVRGNFGCDPLADLAGDGLLHGSLERAFRQLIELADWTTAESSAMRSVMVSTSVYHDAGANAVQELAFALATGIEYLRQMTSGRLSLDAAAEQIEFSFSVGRDFFLEIAKLRAARLLWSKVASAAGIGPRSQAMRIHARTSSLETARVGPWMNLVRGAAQSVAAALGGADSIRTAPWDEALGWPDDHGRRLAANVQHILAEESRLDRVIDAGGGSWYLETLTDQLAREAWTLFQEVEREGGMARAVVQGKVAQRVRDAAAALRETTATRQEPILGASAFADLAEAPYAPKLPERVAVPKPSWQDLAEESGSISIQELLDFEDLKLERGFGDLKRIDAMLAAVELSVEAPGEPGELMELAIDAAEAGARGEQILDALVKGSELAAGEAEPLCDRVERFRRAQPFEDLRARGDRWRESHGRRPQVLLLPMKSDGDAGTVDRGFFRRLFAVGGIETTEAEGSTTVEQAAQRVAEASAEAVLILAGDGRQAEGAELAVRLEPRGLAVLVSGRPDEHEAAYRDAGIVGFVYEGCDVPDLLRRLYERMRVAERVGPGSEVSR